MMHLVLANLWNDITENFANLIKYSIQFFLWYLILGIMPLQNYHGSLTPTTLSILHMLLMALFIFFASALSSLLPLRLCKAFYLCGAGPKEKNKYLLLTLMLKTFLFFIPALLFSWYIGFWKLLSPLTRIIFYSTLFFILFNRVLTSHTFSEDTWLTMDTEKDRKTIGKIYWFLLLLFEGVLFHMAYGFLPTWNLFWIMLWLISLVGNCVFAFVCIPSIFRTLMCYEKIYTFKKE